MPACAAGPSNGASAAPHAGAQIVSQAPLFAPAPVPDPDMLGPAAPIPGERSARLDPHFFHEKRLAETDGYALGSSHNETVDYLREPVAGFNLSVTVK